MVVSLLLTDTRVLIGSIKWINVQNSHGVFIHMVRLHQQVFSQPNLSDKKKLNSFPLEVFSSSALTSFLMEK